MDREMPQGKRTVTDDEIINTMLESSDPFHTAPELADMLGVTRQCIHNRLQALNKKGRVDRKKSGPRTVIWWPAEEEEC